MIAVLTYIMLTSTLGWDTALMIMIGGATAVVVATFILLLAFVVLVETVLGMGNAFVGWLNGR